MSRLLALFIAAIALPAVAQSSQPYTDIGDWQVFDAPKLQGCFVMGSWKGSPTFPGDTYARIGFNGVADEASLMVHNPNWASLVEGRKHPISIEFETGERWDAAALVTSATGLKFCQSCLTTCASSNNSPLPVGLR